MRIPDEKQVGNIHVTRDSVNMTILLRKGPDSIAFSFKDWEDLRYALAWSLGRAPELPRHTEHGERV